MQQNKSKASTRGAAETPPARRTRKRRTPKRRAEPVRYRVSVSAASIRARLSGPRRGRFDADEECRSIIDIEGTLDQPVGRDMRTAGIYVFEGDPGGDPGRAIGISSLWQIVVRLPRPQFDDLRAMLLADKLSTVELVVDELKRGKGAVRVIAFETVPVPSEREVEERSAEK